MSGLGRFRKSLSFVFLILAVAGCSPSSVIDTDFHPSVNVSDFQSRVIASATQVVAGAQITVTVKVSDQNGNAFKIPASDLVFSQSGGSSIGSFSPTQKNADGTFSSNFTGVVPGTATRILASYKGISLGTAQLPLVTVVGGRGSVSNSIVTVSAGTEVSGSAITVTLSENDSSGSPITHGGDTVVFGFSGGTSTGTLSAVTDHGDGTYTATLTGIVSGTASTIQASIDGVLVTSSMPAVSVTPGVFSLSQSRVSSAASVVSGASTLVTLTAKDAAGNLNPIGITATTFTSSGTGTGSYGSITNAGGGFYTANFTGILSGSVTLGATINGGAVAGTPSPATITVTPGAASLANSLVTVSSSSVFSGGTSTLTLTAKDAAGNLLTSGGLTVGFGSSGGSSTGTISSANDNNNGTYTATFTGVLAGTATTLSAAIGGSAITSSMPAITVTPASASVFTSVTSVSASTVASGSTITLTLTAKDGNGNQVSNGGLSVLFTTNGGSSTATIGSTTDHADGTYTAVLTGVLKGTATSIQTTINGTAITTTAPTVQVTSGIYSLAQSGISVSQGTVSSGSVSTLLLTLKDAAGNLITTGGQTVVFTSAGGSSTGTTSATTDNGNGTYTASFTGVTSGTATSIHATIGGATVTSASPSVTVVPGNTSPAQSIITLSSGSVSSGATITATLTAKDGAGNPIGTGGATVVFNSSGGTSTGSFASTVDHGNGTYTATFTAAAAGTATTVGATLGGSPVTSTLPSLTVTAGSPSLSQSVVTVLSSTVTAGQSVSVLLQAKDASGNNVPSGGQTVVFSNSGGVSTGTFGSTTDNGDGTYSATFTGAIAGTATSIKATIGGSPVTSTSPAVQVLIGPASIAQSLVTISAATVASGSALTITLTSKDVAGNALTSGGLSVDFSATGGTSTGNIGSTVDHGNGTYTASFTGVLAGTATSIHSTIAGLTVTTTSPTVTVGSGPISVADSLISVSSATTASAGTVTLTLTAKDASGNSITTGGSTIVFSATGGTSTGTIGSVTDNSNGTYTAVFTGVTAGTATSIHGTIGGVAVTTASPSITVTFGSATKFLLSTISSPQVSGNTFSLAVTAQDAAGNTDTAYTGTVTLTSSDGIATLPAAHAFTGGNAGVYTFTGVAFNTVGTQTITAGDGTITKASNNVTVNPGVATKFMLSAISSPQVSGSTFSLTVTAQDAGGNTVTGYTGTVTLTSSDGAATLPAAHAFTGGNAGVYTFTNIALNTAGTQTITAGDGTISKASNNVTVSPGAFSLAQSIVSSASSVVSGSSITVTLTAKDAAGNANPTGITATTFTSSAVGGTGTYGSITNAGGGVYTASFTGVLSGSVTLGATINATTVTGTPVPATITVNASAATQLSFTTAPSTTGNTDTALSQQPVVTAKDAAGNTAASYSGSITLSVYSATNCTSSVASGMSATTNPVAASSSVASFAAVKILKTSVQSIQASDGTLSVCFNTLAISPGAINSLVFTQPAPLSTDTDAGFTTQPLVTAYDANLNTVTTDSSSSVALTANDTAGCGGATVASGLSGTASSTLSSGVAAFTNVKVVKTSVRGILATLGAKTVCSSTLTVAAGVISATNSTVSASPASLNADDSATTTITVTAKDANNNLVPSRAVTLATNRSVPDSVTAGAANTDASGVITFTATSTYAGSSVYTATGTAGAIAITQTAGVTYNATGVQSVGTYGSSVWKTTGAVHGQGVLDGQLYAPKGTFIDASGNLYVVDVGPSNGSVSRVVKFNSTGTYQGWIGASTLLPTGGANCTSPVLGFGTPGWCTGGLAGAGAGDNKFSQPQGITGDNTYLYIAGGTSSISKVNASTGAFVGWIGKIGSVASLGGATGCSSALVNTFTPGWCTGGSPGTGTGDGMFSTPQQLANDGSNIYVADSGNHRINKYDAGTGAFLGWIGRVSSVTGLAQATGQTNACGSTVTGAATPGWCFGGTSQSGSTDGTFNSPQGVTYVSPYIYVSEGVNARISRFNASTGAFAGWIGKIGSNAGIGGAGTCSTAASGVYTPNWCTGGTVAGSTLVGFAGGIKHIGSDTSYLYLAESSGNRFDKIDLSNGALVGWVGVVGSTAGLGGGTGCSSTAVGQITPAWCTGGASQTSASVEGGIYSAVGATVSGGILYGTDSTNGKINLYDTTTGAYQSWIGTSITSTKTRWANDVVGAHPVAGTNFIDTAFFAPGGIYNDGTDLYVADSGSDGRLKKFGLMSGTFEGWSGFIGNLLPSMGGTGCGSPVVLSQTPNWCTGGTSLATAGTGSASNGMAQTFAGMSGDSTYLYVADSGPVSRINRYKKSDNTFQGWIGNVSSVTGIGMCSGSSAGAATPGWCTGGFSTSSANGDGSMNAPVAVYADGTYIYVADTGNARVNKYNADGTFIGWIGNINSVTGLTQGAGMTNTCASTATANATPGWCQGGTSQAGTAIGMYGGPKGITGDGTYIYVTDWTNNQVSKINASTGAFYGWIGRVSSVTGLATPAGLTNTCATTTTNSPTPGWCTGGTAKSGTTGSALTQPGAIAYSNGYIYVSDITSNGRVVKFDATSGALVGWRGLIATSPTGGDTGCNGAAVGTVTPGWCTGGTSGVGMSIVGSFLSIFNSTTGLGITTDTNYVYATDSLVGRVVRMPK